MTPKTWQTPQCPFSVQYAPAVMEEIRQAAVDAFFSLPHGDAGADGRTVRILVFRPIACEHARGPRFPLSPKDLEHLQALLRKSAADPLLRGLRAVGWYHTHTRSDILLCPQDLAIYDRFFPESRQIALVVRPDGFKPTRGGFFFRDAAGAVHAESTYREFVLEIPSFSTSSRGEPAPATSPAAPVLHCPAPAPAPPQRSFPHPARANRWHRGRGAIAAAFGGLLIAGALTSVESVLAARIVTIAPAPAIVRPALPAPPPAVNVAPPPVESADAVPPETEAEPAPKAPPKPWAGLQSSVPRADVPALPQVPAPDLIAPQLPGAWAPPPIAAGPRRIAFEGGIITFFATSIVIADKKHPQGISLPAHGVDYTCEAKSRSCTLAAGGTRLRVRHAADYKLLLDYLIQTR